MTFRELATGDTFDWIKDGSRYNSFFLRCKKTGARTYRDSGGTDHRVGSLDATVYHVTEEDQ